MVTVMTRPTIEQLAQWNEERAKVCGDMWPKPTNNHLETAAALRRMEKALTNLYKEIYDRHHGRMPDEVAQAMEQAEKALQPPAETKDVSP